jgi:hypothetical protein
MDRRPNDPIRWKDFDPYRRPSVITLAWRWRTEIALIVALVGLEYGLAQVMGLISGVLVTVAAAEILYAVPATRRWIARRGWCLFTRHRLYSVFRETKTTTLKGRLPLIMRVSPTDYGERVVVWCRAGISVERLQGIESEIRDACMADEVDFQPVRAPCTQIEIVRRASKSQSKRRMPSPRHPSNDDLEDL